MPCEEFRKLNLRLEMADWRVKRYCDPDAKPQLAIPSGPRLKRRLKAARAEQREIRVAMEDHAATCEACRNLVSNLGHEKLRIEEQR